MLKVRSIHEIQHDGINYKVAKTNKGHLLLFSFAKKVEPSDFVEMMNSHKDSMMWKGHVDEAAIREFYRNLAWSNVRTLHRLSGPFEVKSKSRRGALKVVRRVVKPTVDHVSSPLEEALILLEGHRSGVRCELPVAVFIPRLLTRLPEMVFTTHIPHNRSRGSWTALEEGAKRGPVHFEDFLSVGKMPERWVGCDAEFSVDPKYLKPGSIRQRVIHSAAELRKKLKQLR